MSLAVRTGSYVGTGGTSVTINHGLVRIKTITIASSGVNESADTVFSKAVTWGGQGSDTVIDHYTGKKFTRTFSGGSVALTISGGMTDADPPQPVAPNAKNYVYTWVAVGCDGCPLIPYCG